MVLLATWDPSRSGPDKPAGHVGMQIHVCPVTNEKKIDAQRLRNNIAVAKLPA